MMLKATLLLALVGPANAFVPMPTTVEQDFYATSTKLQSTTLPDEEIEIVAPQSTAAVSEGEMSNPDPSAVPSPGLEENGKFTCDESVAFWREFQADGFHTAQQNIQSLAQVSSRFAAKGPDGLRYWLRHVGRTSYFAVNAALGTLGYQVHERLVGSRNNIPGDSDGDRPTPFLSNFNSAMGTRLLLESSLCFEQDYEKIEKGVYGQPWDMVPDHRQSSPQNVLLQSSRFVRDSIGVLIRRNKGDPKDKQVDASGTALVDYPDYYKNAFHYQKNGWLSKESAEVYEIQTETLFLGRQDAMQRTTLPPLLKRARMIQDSRREEPMKVLEIACGTGRFMTFARDNLPLKTEYTAIDLSPFYLDVARENDGYWRKTRQRKEEQNGAATMQGTTELSPARIIQAKAESLPFEDGSFDAVICIYLFHEMPHKIRERVAAEMARVVRPNGGTVVLTDSVQLGDRPVLNANLKNFGNFNEPHYVSYIKDRLPVMFERAGLICETKAVRSTTKSLSFSKP